MQDVDIHNDMDARRAYAEKVRTSNEGPGVDVYINNAHVGLQGLDWIQLDPSAASGAAARCAFTSAGLGLLLPLQPERNAARVPDPAGLLSFRCPFCVQIEAFYEFVQKWKQQEAAAAQAEALLKQQAAPFKLQNFGGDAFVQLANR